MACYYGSWAVYRPGLGKFDVEDIDPFLCTHILYAFAGLQESTGTIVSLDPYNDLYDNYGKGAYIRFTSLKRINPDLKTLLSIGGWNEGSRKYSQMASTATSRSTFITSCVKFLLKYGFDGLDMDWEFPTLRGGQPEDKVNFALLLEEMKTRFKQHGLLLTSAVSGGKATIDASYNVTALATNLDYVFLMAYDFHGTWEKYAHHHSPLYAYRGDKGPNKLLNVDFAVRYWLQVGLPSERLVMGVGTYGRCFTLARADYHDVYAPAPQPGKAGPYTRTPGVLGYNEVCEQQQQVNWTVVRDKNMVSPYAYYERQWCGYDDVTSVSAKAKYIKSLGLAGAMVWTTSTDDFHGICLTQEADDEGEEEGEEAKHNETFPLITTIRTILRDGRPIPTPMPSPVPIEPTTETTTTTTSTTTTPPVPPPPPPPPPSTICHREGLNRDPAGDCTIYYFCHQVAERWVAWLFHCPPGTRFVENMQTCDHPQGHPTCPLLPPVTEPSANAITTNNNTINTMSPTFPFDTAIAPPPTSLSIPSTIITPAATPPTINGFPDLHNTQNNLQSGNSINYFTNLIKSERRLDKARKMDSSNTLSSSSQMPGFSPSLFHSSSSSSSSKFPEKTKRLRKWRNTYKFLSYNAGHEILAPTG